MRFIRSHKRLPNKAFLNDHLYKIKVSDEILDVLRQYTSDKELVKYYISNTVGDELNVKTKAILRNADEIRSYDFSVGDVVKPTHSSGQVSFVKGSAVDKDEFIRWLNSNYYSVTREANYRYLTPKIIVEEAIFGRTDVDDIKFFCVGGKAKVIQWDFDRHDDYTQMLYDRDWTALDASMGARKSKKSQPKPKKLDEMIAVAEKLAQPFSLVRVDLFYDEETEQYLVGELTHCTGSSNNGFDSKESEVRGAKELFC